MEPECSADPLADGTTGRRLRVDRRGVGGAVSVRAHAGGWVQDDRAAGLVRARDRDVRPRDSDTRTGRRLDRPALRAGASRGRRRMLDTLTFPWIAAPEPAPPTFRAPPGRPGARR